MCRNKGCDMRMANMCVCCVVCKCEKTCYECWYGTSYYNHNWSNSYECNSFEVRNKYVCFPCKRIWKSPVSKYQANKITNYDWIKKHNWYSITNNKYDRVNEIVNIKKADKDSYINVYDNKKSKCAQCKNDGIYVGRNFRHCKTDKEWKELEKKYKNNEIDLYWDFHEYPREGTKECYDKFVNKRNMIEKEKQLNLELYNIPILPTAPIFLR